MTFQQPSRTNFLTAFLRLTRIWNLVIIGLTQYFTAAFLIGFYTVHDVRLFLLSASTILIAAAGYIINDYYDIKIDFINKPDRVIVGKVIPRRFAILWHVLLSMLGILLGLYLSWKIAVINIFSVFLLWLYSNSLKRQPFIGNLTVAFLTGLAVLIVDVLYRTSHHLILIYSIFAFFMTLIREIIKDMEDLKGDHTYGCRTLPIIWGLRRTKIIIYCILAIFFVIVLVFNQFYTKLAALYFIAFLFTPLLAFILWLARADKKHEFKWLSACCKVIMLLGILSMAFL